MVFYVKVKGKVIDEGISRKGKRYLRIYDGNSLLNVFVDRPDLYNTGDEVEINCMVIADRCYIREYDGYGRNVG